MDFTNICENFRIRLVWFKRKKNPTRMRMFMLKVSVRVAISNNMKHLLVR